jgi:hypothetical protein
MVTHTLIDNAMLIFKKNIYAPQQESHPENPPIPLSHYDFLLNALVSDRRVFIGLAQEKEQQDHLQKLFPHASRFGGLQTLNAISKNLLEGLVTTNTWLYMNAYHLCYLFDTLYGMIEEYSYGDFDQRMEMFPEMDGEIIDFDRFLEETFISTAFLISPEGFNALSPEEKESPVFQIPCLFGVINKLTPTPDEIRLLPCEKDPYGTTGQLTS